MPPPLRRWNAHPLDPLTAGDAAWQALFAAIRAKLAEPVLERALRILDLPKPKHDRWLARHKNVHFHLRHRAGHGPFRRYSMA